MNPAAWYGFKLHTCLVTCSLCWLPVALLERAGYPPQMGLVGCITYSLMWVVGSLYVLAPRARRGAVRSG